MTDRLSAIAITMKCKGANNYMKKILSVAVPCYNSEAYMRNCIESLLVGGDDVEILIVDDGSKDQTAAIADEYQEKYPTICRAIHQENGGHGEAVNTGLKNATGHFFKVVDSDDRVAKEAYNKLLGIMKKSILEEKPLDMLLSNYVYDKVDVKRKRVMRYASVLPVDKYFTWEDIGHFRKDQYILMHSVIYRTQLLKDCNLVLPKHTFYVDNIFVFQPLPYVRVMYYADVNFYWYFIGREDQSVHEDVMIKRIDQQLRVNRLMIDYYNPDEIFSTKCRKYMLNYLEMITTVSSIMAILSKSDENLHKKKELWMYLKDKDPVVYKKIRGSILGIWMNFPGKMGRRVSVLGYKATQKIFGFN